MSSIDFALKDFYRNRQSNYPYLFIITLIIAVTEFLIYFTTAIGLNLFIQTDFSNQFYFSGGIYLVYKRFNTLIQVLILILSVIIVIVVTTTLVISKKRDIAIMKSLGTLPRKLYSFYLLEAFILFFIGFLLGLFFGFIAYGLFVLIMSFYNYPINFQIDIIYTPILFVCCVLGIFIITGYTLRKIGRKSITKTFSKDIPYNYDASKSLTFIPKWLTTISFNFKIAVVNTIRKKGEFKRYLIVFSVISLIIFTLGLGTIVLTTSSREWIYKSQNENIVVIGHEDVIYNYSLLYKMFSDPTLVIDRNDINFIESQYLFFFSDISELRDVQGIEKVDERLINFYNVEEVSGVHISEDDTYLYVGQNRQGNVPIIGVNPENLIQNFEIEGTFFTNEDADDVMNIGDGLAYNFFEYALDQSLRISPSGKIFHISGVVIDSFYSGWAGYVGLDVIQQELNLTTEINLVLIKLENGVYNKIKIQLTNISNNLGPGFSHLKLDNIFHGNLIFLSNLSMYPAFLIVVISILSILSLYNYQKAGLMEKAKDFLIMRAIGSKTRSLKKILFTESIFIQIPSLFLSLAIGMILNSSFLFDRINLPPLYIPFTLLLIQFILFLIFNYLSLVPIIKKINRFTISDFNMY